MFCPHVLLSVLSALNNEIHANLKEDIMDQVWEIFNDFLKTFSQEQEVFYS